MSKKEFKEILDIAINKDSQTILVILSSMERVKYCLKTYKSLLSKKDKVTLYDSTIIMSNGSKIYFSTSHNPDKFRGLRLDTVFVKEDI